MSISERVNGGGTITISGMVWDISNGAIAAACPTVKYYPAQRWPLDKKGPFQLQGNYMCTSMY